MGPRTRRRDFCGHIRSRVPLGPQGRPAFACLASPIASGRRELSRPSSVGGWDQTGALRFATPHGVRLVHADAVVLALGGGSWPRFGSDGRWVSLLAGRGVSIEPLRPANCGFDVNWSRHIRTRFAGHPVKPVVVAGITPEGVEFRRQGEFVVTETGIEGGVIYGVSAWLRDEILAKGMALIRA